MGTDIKVKEDQSDEDMVKILRATNLLNGWRLRMKKEYEAEEWHLRSAIDAFSTAMDAISMSDDDDDDI